MSDQSEKREMIQVITGDEMSRGRYSNNMVVTHTPEEFCIDWMLNAPNGTHLISRIMVNPGHMKRIVAALTDNLKKYESRFGEIKLIQPKDQMYQ